MIRPSRRVVLRGGGALLALPLLEGVTRALGGELPFAARSAHAAVPDEPAYAIFLRQACGVASRQTTTEAGHEPERFWPRGTGKLTAAAARGRAIEELEAHFNRLLVVKNVNMFDFPYDDGHARGAFQGLTARGPMVAHRGGDSEAGGESIDHRIGAELNPGGRDSLFLYAGPSGGWLGGACISHRGPGRRRSALDDPRRAFDLLTGGARRLSNSQVQRLGRRQKSVNDLVRTQMQALLSSQDLSVADRHRLEQHLSAVRDLEQSLCWLSDADEAQLAESRSALGSTNGEDVMRLVALHAKVAALAVGCGYTRSVAIQIGNGNDGSTRYLDPRTGRRMENYHFVSHRRLSHDGRGAIIDGAAEMHHQVDRCFARMFKSLIDELEQRPTARGRRLIDAGVSVWYNDHGDGPAHGYTQCPFVFAGSAGGQLRQGEIVRLRSGGANHGRLLASIAGAVGVHNARGEPLDQFGDESLGRGRLDELFVTR